MKCNTLTIRHELLFDEIKVSIMYTLLAKLVNVHNMMTRSVLKLLPFHIIHNPIQYLAVIHIFVVIDVIQ